MRPPAPESLPGPVVDDHAHLDLRRDAEDAWTLDEALTAAADVGVARVVQIGCDLASARWTAGEAVSHPAVLGGVALHPTEAAALAADGDRGAAALTAALDEIASLATHPRIRVVGETGLDHYWVPEEDRAGRAAQEEAFRWHIRLAKQLGKVLQIHDRDAHADVMRILEEEGAPDRTVFHCFSGDAAMARRCAERGWYLSFAGTITFRNAHSLREALCAVPADLVLAETDAPFLTPAPHRGRPNGSYLLPHTVRAMAEAREVPLERWCERLWDTANDLYGPW